MSTFGIRKPRPANACRECKRRKLKCDQARPTCSRCNDTPGSQCAYLYNAEDNGPIGIQFVNPIVGSSSEIAGSSGTALSGDMAVPVERLNKLEERVENLAAIIRKLQDTDTTEATEASRSEQCEDPSQMSKRVRPLVSIDQLPDNNAGHLNVQAGGRTRYISRSHWASISEETTEIELLLRSQIRYDLSSSTAGDPRPSSNPLSGTLLSSPPAWNPSEVSSSKFRRKLSLHLLELPDQTCCDALFEEYTRNFHPVVPLTHIPSLQKDYQTFWDLRNSSKEQSTSHSNPLVYAALYAGAVVCPRVTLERYFHSTNREAIASALHRTASKALQHAHFPRAPTVESLSAYLIIQGTWMREEEPLATCSFVGVAVRIAQMLGLHKDPLAYSTMISPLAAEIRRRVWWHVFHVDVIIAMASGLPPLITKGSWNTSIVSELREEHIGTFPGVQYDIESRTTDRDPDDHSLVSSLTSPMGIWLRGKIHESCKFLHAFVIEAAAISDP
jgi:hypothetical protein